MTGILYTTSVDTNHGIGVDRGSTKPATKTTAKSTTIFTKI